MFKEVPTEIIEMMRLKEQFRSGGILFIFYHFESMPCARPKSKMYVLTSSSIMNERGISLFKQ